MDLNELVVFAKVVQTGSFIGAARELDMPKSTVSRKVADLEEHLGARLLQRTTRQLKLTDVGQVFYQHAIRVVVEAEEAKLAVMRMQDVPRGLLRVTIPVSFHYLGPIFASFLELHPEVQLDVVCADRLVDLVHEGFDLGIRAGKLADSTLIARQLGVLRSVVVASPAFLEAHGTPRSPQDLSEFDCVVFGAGSQRTSWKLQVNGATESVSVKGRLVVNDFDIVHQVAIAGLGLAMLPLYRCSEDLKRNRLRRVLESYCSPEVPIHAVYPSTRHLSPKVRAFLDHLQQRMNPPPWESDGASEVPRP